MLNNIVGVLGVGGPAIIGDFDSIQTYTVGAGGQASITFSSIPSTYKHLQIRSIYKTNNTNGGSTRINFNSDTGNNYASHYILGDSSSASASGVTSSAYLNSGIGDQSTSQFGVHIVDILDYTNTNKYKTTRSLAGVDNNSSGTISLVSGLWMNTSAITSITLSLQSNTTPANTYLQYSHFALYGIKA